MDYLVDQSSFIPEEWKPAVKKNVMGVVAWSDWFVGLRDPRDVLQYHPSLLFYEFAFYFFGLLTFIHAWRTGSRYWYTWIAIMIHGLNTEGLSYAIPDFDSFWHAQATVMFLGRRLPAQVLPVYAVFIYTAYVAARKMKLPWWAEGPAAGLFAVLLDLPYDILGIKNLWWSWHDTDPNIYDRTYHVPWTSYYFHASFACSLVWLLRFTRNWLLPVEYDWKLFPREFVCCLISGMSAFWLGALQFIPIYHVLHDVFGVHTEICTLSFLALYATIVFHAIANRDSQEEDPDEDAYLEWVDCLGFMLILYYMFFVVLSVVAEPAEIQSIGLHEPIGENCKRMVPVQTVRGMVLQKRQFLCGRDFDEPYYNWQCEHARGIPPEVKGGVPVEWYAICGTPFKNQAEYVALVSIISAFGFYFFFQAMSRCLPLPPVKIYKRKQQ